MVAEQHGRNTHHHISCSLAKISMVAEQKDDGEEYKPRCSLAKISMVAELFEWP